MEGTMVTQDKLIELLKEGEVVVSFTKKDGTTRVMTCTKNKDLMTFKVSEPTDKKTTRKENPNQIRVYDLTEQAWRSFNYDTVFDVQIPNATGVDPVTKAIGGVVVAAAILSLLIGVS